MTTYPIPDSHYTIDDDLHVRTHTGRVIAAKPVNGAPKVQVTIAGKRVWRRPDELLALARDGLPILDRRLLPKREAGLRTLTLRQHWDELRERTGADWQRETPRTHADPGRPMR